MNVLAMFKGFKGKISLQCRFEMLTAEFIQLCSDLIADGCQITLELGIQTANSNEAKAIRRGNQLTKILNNAKLLNAAKIPFEVSLIYGLPLQTVDSFKQSIEFSQSLQPTRLVAWPLMLLRGTELYHQKELFDFKETLFGFDEMNQLSTESNRLSLGIPHVVSSNSFTFKDWTRMNDLARRL